MIGEEAFMQCSRAARVNTGKTHQLMKVQD